jgi:hypothetical protein
MSETNGGGQIYGRMAKVMADIGAIGKDRKNQQQGYQFRGIDDVYNALHDILAKHEVFFLPQVLDHDIREVPVGKEQKLWASRTGRVKFTFYAPDGSSVEAITLGEGMDNGDKSANKLQSAAAKYALIQAFCIPTQEMIDSETESPERTAPRQQQRQTQKPAASSEKASPEQVAEMKSLLSVVRLPDGTTAKWFKAAKVGTWEEMSAETLAKCIDYTKDRLPQPAAV